LISVSRQNVSIATGGSEVPAIPLCSILPDELGELFWEALEEALRLVVRAKTITIRLLMNGGVWLT
jgi:hypothetical protein